MSTVIEDPHDRRGDSATVLLEGFHSLETPEGFRAELIEGEILVTPPPTGNHENNVSSVIRQVLRRSSTTVSFSGNKGLVLRRGGACPENHLIPDGVFVPQGAFRDEPPWMPVDPVVMVLEVTGSHPDRDRELKRRCYARGAVPLYLLLDRETRTTTLFGAPGPRTDSTDYTREVRVPFGTPLDLPEPFGLTLETAEFV
ncbi:Uma2 family endonuclease [Nocardia aurea]|uniref:Uma2 family endonuclease n=1 Tax=Nocardia aurea TaxID=2144174 RepID=A0ABV3FPR8_9NOCA